MLISLIGSHGTGKTTVVSKLHIALKAENSTFAIITEVARHCPYPIGTTSSKLSQDWIITTQKYVEDNCLNMCCPVITDRNMIDQYAYFKYWAGENKDIENELRDRYSRDSLIYLMPRNPDFLISDGIRPTDKKFQNDINTIIMQLIDKLEKSNSSLKINVFDDNSANIIVDAVMNYVPMERVLKKVTAPKFSYDNNLLNNLVLTNNLSLHEQGPERFEKMFYEAIILSAAR